MNGQRKYDSGYQYIALHPGDYINYDNPDVCGWYAMAPNGFMCNLGQHTITEHDDGTITVYPSILVSDGTNSWHGHLERGIWRET